jgi:hypothetical protein
MSSLAQALIEYAATGGKSLAPITRALSQRSQRYPGYSEQTRPVGPDDAEGGGDGAPSAPFQGGSQSGSTFVLPRTWKGTHVTDGLGWGTKTAEDIMLKAGTALGAPEAGHVVYYHPTGAQGGGSMLFDPDAPGPDYWIGHIEGSAPIGKRVKRGQRISTVSSKHAAPHAHVDRRW